MRRRAPLALGVLAGAVALTASFAIRNGGTVSGGSSSALTGELRYEVGWSWEGAEWEAERQDYRFVTDRGYTVRISAGYIGTASLELVPCPAPSGPAKAMLDFFTPQAAWANHGYVHDASLLEAPFADSAFAKEPVAFGVTRTSGKPYCQLHELIVPLDQRAADGFHLDHWSAFARGSFALPNMTEEHPFEAHVNLRGGALVELKNSASPSPSGMPLVRVTRSPLRAFDGVELEKLTQSELAYAFLRGLTKGTRAELHLPR